LTAADRAVLDGVAARLKELEFVGGEVAGRTDSVGDEGYNLALSKRRALNRRVVIRRTDCGPAP
jgi:outer membrane protein OmpA-like peptidoglycan-associated protein